MIPMRVQIQQVVGLVVCVLAVGAAARYFQDGGHVAQMVQEDGYISHVGSTPNAEDIRFGAFNIQILGVSKVNKPEILAAIIKILLRYDIVVLQEIRDVSGEALPKLVQALNAATLDKYQVKVSARLGRSKSKEQYAYLFRPSKVAFVADFQYDPGCKDFERPPYVVRFSSKTAAGDFFVVVVHTSPRNAKAEINALTDVYNHGHAMWNMEDAIIAGDFNAGCDYVRPVDWPAISLRSQQRFLWLIGDDARTNLAQRACPYDRLVLAGNRMRTSYKDAAVFRFDQALGISIQAAKKISDHFPVEFVIKGK